jgi:hypothetical protein
MSAVAMTSGAIERSIHLLRGHKVIFDVDLARLYGVQTGALNQAVKRNRARFPADFMFQLTVEEEGVLKCQSGISRSHGGRRRSRPFAFTEHGVVMLSSVLNSPRAVAVNIEVVRVFVRLRQVLATHPDLARKLDELERRVGARFAEQEKQLRVVFEAVRQLMVEETESDEKPKIGFETS